MNNARSRARLIRTRRRRSFSHVYYVSPGSDENMLKSDSVIYQSTSQLSNVNIVKLIQQAEIGGPKITARSTELGIRRMIEGKMFKEHILPLSTNKIFCSEWLPDDRIVMGTKCNQLLVYDIKSYMFTFLPKFENSQFHCGSPATENGIHAIHTNPSKTCLVTGGPHSNDVGVYTIPDLQPLCLGENAHKDWVFDLKWLDDEHFVSGSRDGKIALWSITRKEEVWNPKGYYYIKPSNVKTCELADKVRALSFQPSSALTTLSCNSYLHHWDMQRFEQLSSHKLPYSRETVSLAHSPEHKLFAVGSSSHITFVDSTTHAFIRSMKTKFRESSVRSLSFKGNVVTIGTGFGMVHFYDLIAGKYLDNSECVTSPGASLFPTYIFDDLFVHTAVYTHCYDTTGTRLFTAGGPWALNVNGSYAALWM